MTTEIPQKLASLSDADFQSWIEQTVEQLRAGDFHQIDIDNLVEEIESLGKRDKRSLLSYLRQLCEHLLKVQYWQSARERSFRGWRLEIRNFRSEIQDILEDSPSLKNYLKTHFSKIYKDGRERFLEDSELAAVLVPEEPAFTLEQALDESWLPWKPE